MGIRSIARVTRDKGKVRIEETKPKKQLKARTAAAAGAVTVQVDEQLGPRGVTLASEIAADLQAAYEEVCRLFAATQKPAVTCVIAALSDAHDGTGGAYHMSCYDTALVCDADFTDGQRTVALFVAELVEVFEALQGGGFDCGNTNGEALSRALAEEVVPGVLDDYSTAAAWLDTPDRPDWIGRQQGSDTDPVSVGCGVLFLWWLVETQGVTLANVIAAGGANLAQTYAGLGLGGDAYEQFRAACDAAWPVGTPSGVTTDDPWGGVSPAPQPQPAPAPTPAPAPGPASPLASLTVSTDCPAGSYWLIPVPAPAQAKHLALPPGLLQQLIAGVLQVLLPILAKAAGAGPQQAKAPAAVSSE